MIFFRFASQQYSLEAGQLWVDDKKEQQSDFFRDTKANDIYGIIEEIKNGVPWRDAVSQRYREASPWLNEIVTSPKRDLYLRQFPIPEGSKVLDIGAGWGQYSLPLAKTCEVTALEPTPERLAFIKAAAEQERLQNNMHFLEASFLEVDFETKFDYVFCIGVLEWVPAFASGDPRELQLNFLRRIRNALADDGKLVLAIENRIGLKYILGTDDDHIGLPDIATYDAKLAAEKLREATGKDLRSFTFSRSELDNLLKEAGFSSNDFLGAYPDYKLPEKILPFGQPIDEFLSEGYSIIEHSGTDGSPVKSQRELVSHYKTFAELGIASEFAPSFIVEATPVWTLASDEVIKDALIRHGVVSSTQSIRISRYPTRHHRRDKLNKQACRVFDGEHVIFHLTISTEDLSAQHARSKAFAEGCPELACKPLFYFHDETSKLHALGVEYFEGESLDDRVLKKSCDAKTWMLAVETVRKKLDSTVSTGTKSGMEEELSGILANISAIAGFGELDQVVLTYWVKPYLEKITAELPPNKCWTNGDFHGGNILWDGGNQFRLVDYEYASESYFSNLDWFFLQKFSILPPQLTYDDFWSSVMPHPELEILFWLKHIQMMRDIMPTYEAEKRILPAISRCINLAYELQSKPSLLIKAWQTATGHAEFMSCNTQEGLLHENQGALANGSNNLSRAVVGLKNELAQAQDQIRSLDEQLKAKSNQLSTQASKLKSEQKTNQKLKERVSQIRKEIERWNKRSWVKRAFHRLRIKT